MIDELDRLAPSDAAGASGRRIPSPPAGCGARLDAQLGVAITVIAKTIRQHTATAPTKRAATRVVGSVAHQVVTD